MRDRSKPSAAHVFVPFCLGRSWPDDGKGIRDVAEFALEALDERRPVRARILELPVGGVNRIRRAVVVARDLYARL